MSSQKLKLKLKFCTIALVLVSFSGCKKSVDPVVSAATCDKYVTAFQDENAAFIANQFTSNCNAFKTAASNLINNCTTYYSGFDKAKVQQQIAAMDCSKL